MQERSDLNGPGRQVSGEIGDLADGPGGCYPGISLTHVVRPVDGYATILSSSILVTKGLGHHILIDDHGQVSR